MNMDLETIAGIVNSHVCGATAICLPEINQVIVRFKTRPDVDVALLTPWQQNKIKRNAFDTDELFPLLSELNTIGGMQI